jgi:spermidine/putrescine-binding protein
MKHTPSILIALLFAAVLTSCSPPQDQPPTVEDKVLMLYNWEDYMSDDVIAKFTEETGIRVQQTTFLTADEAFATIEQDPSAYDLIIIDDSTTETLAEVKLLRELDKSLLSGFDKVDPRYLNLSADRGNRHTVPYAWGTSPIAYRKDKIPAPTSWKDLWNTNYAGHIMMFDDDQENFAIALLMLGYEMNTTDSNELAEAAQALIDQVPLVAAHTNFKEILDALETGDCWIAPNYSGDAAARSEENENIHFVIPQEGAPFWVDQFLLPRDAPHPEYAHAFIAFMLRPEIAAENGNQIWFPTALPEANAMLDPEILNHRGLFPPKEILDKCKFFKKVGPAQISIFNETRAEIDRLQMKNDMP